jgi:hypothetical protein
MIAVEPATKYIGDSPNCTRHTLDTHSLTKCDGGTYTRHRRTEGHCSPGFGRLLCPGEHCPHPLTGGQDVDENVYKRPYSPRRRLFSPRLSPSFAIYNHAPVHSRTQSQARASPHDAPLGLLLPSPPPALLSIGKRALNPDADEFGGWHPCRRASHSYTTAYAADPHKLPVAVRVPAYSDTAVGFLPLPPPAVLGSSCLGRVPLRCASPPRARGAPFLPPADPSCVSATYPKARGGVRARTNLQTRLQASLRARARARSTHPSYPRRSRRRRDPHPRVTRRARLRPPHLCRRGRRVYPRDARRRPQVPAVRQHSRLAPHGQATPPVALPVWRWRSVLPRLGTGSEPVCYVWR